MNKKIYSICAQKSYFSTNLAFIINLNDRAGHYFNLIHSFQAFECVSMDLRMKLFNCRFISDVWSFTVFRFNM